MQTFVAAVLLFALVMAAMAVGVIFSNRRLQGSCGGTGLDCTCDETTRDNCELAKHAHAQADSS